ncbi:hypothetical protein PG984_011212 [Apiospora sp. TS-2023a]
MATASKATPIMTSLEGLERGERLSLFTLGPTDVEEIGRRIRNPDSPVLLDTLPLREQLSLLSLSRFDLTQLTAPCSGTSDDAALDSGRHQSRSDGVDSLTSDVTVLDYKRFRKLVQEDDLTRYFKGTPLGTWPLGVTRLMLSDWFAVIYSEFNEACQTVGLDRLREASSGAHPGPTFDELCIGYVQREAMPLRPRASADARLAKLRFLLHFRLRWKGIKMGNRYTESDVNHLRVGNGMWDMLVSMHANAATNKKYAEVLDALQNHPQRDTEPGTYTRPIPLWMTKAPSQPDLDQFHRFHAAYLRQSGVSPGHFGICILGTACAYTLLDSALEGKHLDRALYGTIKRVTNEKAPGFAPAGTKYYVVVAHARTPPLGSIDHTQEERVAVFKEGSHLCHNHFCSIHVTLESRVLNNDRKKCHNSAQALRSYGHKLPPHCTLHTPPCLLQLAALTTIERLCVQLNVVNEAKGAPLEKWDRPDDHMYPTFVCTRQAAARLARPDGENTFTAEVVDLRPQGVQSLRTG